MKKFLCAILLVLPGIAFFMDDFGAATIWLRIFGVCLMLIVVSDYVFKKNLIIPVCKFVYFFAWMFIPLIKFARQRRKNKRERDIQAIRNFHWYW